jgi:hypothetical protein
MLGCDEERQEVFQMSYFIINVARRGMPGKDGQPSTWIPPRHIFRTDRGSIDSEHRAREVARMLRVAFPANEYSIDISKEQVLGEYLEFTE